MLNNLNIFKRITCCINNMTTIDDKLENYDFTESKEELRKTISILRIENKKLIEMNKLECDVKHNNDNKYKEEIQDLQVLVDKNTNIVEYLNNQLDKYKKLFSEIKKEVDKVK